MPAKTTAKTKRPTSSFLSAEDIEAGAKDAAANDSYVGLSKLDEGKPHRYRFLGPGVTGYGTWIETNGKSSPIRWKRKPVGDEIPGNLQVQKSGKPAEIKRFIAGFVWDYAKEKISVLLIDQKTIALSLYNYINDDEFGDPQTYDIKITRTKDGDYTKYTLTASPPKPVVAAIMAEYNKLMETANLQALFDNGNPFDPDVQDDEDEDDEDENDDDEDENDDDDEDENDDDDEDENDEDDA